MEYLTDLLQLYLAYGLHFLGMLFRPDERIFILYLVSSLIFAFAVYKYRTWQNQENVEAGRARGFLAFLFPKRVWAHPSAWLDVRYFVFHKMIGHFLLFGLAAGCTAWGYALVTGGGNLAEMARRGDEEASMAVAVFYMFAFFIVSDLLAYAIHYLQHRVPILWEFHKVHHSSEVMHPLSNFREHPVDNLSYMVLVGGGNGVFMGLAGQFLGYLPSMPSVLGVPLLMFLFNVMGYNLRHSHVWLRWRGNWSKVIPSPAHHHVHHSCHPDHLDKNFAFMFPVWDVLFGTYEMPETNKDVKFGVFGMEENDMDSCAKLYFMPFKKAFRRLRSKDTPADGESVLPPG